MLQKCVLQRVGTFLSFEMHILTISHGRDIFNKKTFRSNNDFDIFDNAVYTNHGRASEK